MVPYFGAAPLLSDSLKHTRPSSLSPAPVARIWRACLVYAVLHLAAHLSASWFEVSEGVSLWYPPAGLALSLLLLLGPRFSPVVFAANLTGALIAPGIEHWWDPWLFPALITTVLAAIAWIVRRTNGPILLPGMARDTAVFAIVTVAAPALLAVAGTAVVLALGLNPPGGFLEPAIRWWVGDASGILTTLPLCMVAASRWLAMPGAPAGMAWDERTLLAFCGRLAVLVGCLVTAFAIDPDARYNAFFLTILPLVWISIHHGLLGATVATLVLTIGSLTGLHLVQASTPQVISFLIFEVSVAVVGLGIGATVSRRDAAEARVIASEARLDRVLTGAHLGLWDWHLPSSEVTYNARCAEILGVPLERLERVEPSWQEFAHPADRSRIAAALAAHLDGRSTLYEVDFRVRTRSGEWRWIHARGSVVERDSAGQPVTVSGTHLDITDRFGTEAEARRLMQIIEVTTDFVLTTDIDGTIVHANAALLRLLAQPTLANIRGRAMDEILPAAATSLLRAEAIPTALRARSWLGETVLHDATGQSLPVSLVVLLHHGGVDERELLSYTMRDLSPQKATEAEKVAQERRLHQVQKNESLGVLAGGVAHDFNNLLTTVLGNANLARLDLPPDAPQQELLAQIETAAGRAGELCQLMLAYAGRAPLAFSDLDVSALVEESGELLLATAGRGVDMTFELGADLPKVHAARPQLQQVLVNLVVNAAEALGGCPGRVVVRTRAHTFGTAELAQRTLTHALLPGDYVLLEVEDDGPGMSAQTRARIFEPFFTTKFTGQGLGLAAVHGIVSSHEGSIEVISAPGQGSTFRILLPAQHATALAASALRPAAADRAPRGLALIVDDEPGVRRTACRLMQSLGYETIGASDGEEALNEFRRCSDRLEVVLLDLTMPKLDGETAFERMQATCPEVPVVMMSGYSERLTPERFKARPPAAILLKPFDRHALAEALDTANARTAAHAPSPEHASGTRR